jgi:hypothetical protein
MVLRGFFTPNTTTVWFFSHLEGVDTRVDTWVDTWVDTRVDTLIQRVTKTVIYLALHH